MKVGEKIRDIRKKKGLTQKQLAEALNVKQTAVSYWESGKRAVDLDTLRGICDYFGLSYSTLLEENPNKHMGDDLRDMEDANGESLIRGVKIPVLGRVAAGVPLEMVEDIIDTEEIPVSMAKTGEYFGLQIHGDSMEPRIYEGDVVIVRKQDDAESGEVVIVSVNGMDATCKRIMKYENGIQLLSLNSKYSPRMFSNREIEDLPVKILGKVVELRGKLKF